MDIFNISNGETMEVKMLPAEYNTTYMVSRLLYEPHIYKGQDDRMKDIWWVHRFFTEIEHGDRYVFGVFSEDNEFLGCVHGTLEDGNFIAHTMFRRKVDAVKASLRMVEIFKEYCADRNLPFHAVVGYPPEDSRIAILNNKRFGCKDMGIAEGIEFYRNGLKVPCRYMRKDI